MKRYIRTKYGEIYDTEGKEISIFSYDTYPNIIAYRFDNDEILKKDIIIESDNIFDLIMIGDLVEAKMYECCDDYFCEDNHIAKVSKISIMPHDYYNDNIYECGLSHIRDEDIETISKIYTKQGDNYILVWDKESGVI